ncbi:putative bifunctional diguanylate cyclase/phosphodiesterase [Novosphingobium sp.]|uniref:putative bifunctional diguanylate cyclase/phosphodiesterase n=1 Tax=Novosphingobium sp. TaxID=1874826 RepID=UPI0035B474FF
MVTIKAVRRTAVPPELRDWAESRLLNAHIRIIKPMVLGSLLNALLLIAVLRSEIPAFALTLFGAYMLAACLHRLWLAEGVERGRRQKRVHRMVQSLRLNSWWLGLNFAVFIGWWLPHVSSAGQILLAVSGLAQIASAAFTIRTLPGSATIYIASQALGLAIGLAQLGSPAAGGAIIVLVSASLLLIRMAYSARELFVTRILSDRELSASARTVKLLLNEYEESGSDWLFELDAEHRLTGVSQRFARAAGEHPETLEGRLFASLFAPGPARDTMADALARGHPLRNCELEIDGTGDGESRWWSISGRPTFEGTGDRAAWRGIISDVTMQRQAESRANRMAHFDTLTGLPNRALFERSLANLLDTREAGDQVALLFVDVDHFKTINDMLGHPVGDSFLRDFADRLSNCVRHSGLGGTQNLVARLGGDEFAIVVTGADACDHAVRLSELLLVTMAETVTVDGHELTSGVSIGIALAPFHAELPQQLQSYADIALNAAKSAGRGIWEMFEPGMDARLHERHALGRDLRQAVGRSELRLFLQPLVDVESEAKTGYEALLRWQHPERGLVPPDTFIPIAEETGLIVGIGEWVIRTAFAEAATWAGGETIAINLSPVQIESPGLLPVIVSALAESGIDPARVEFEITEGVLLNNTDANLAMLKQLQNLGVKIALDDFGTGYSSLNYLLTFPFDKIKIDRSFVSELVTRAESGAIVAAVIALANQLGMCTLAEGVEEPEQLDRLKQHGCRMVQGWLFGKALPSEDYHPRGHENPAQAAKAPAIRLPRRRKARTTQTYSGRARA